MNATLATAKRDFSIGYLMAFALERAPMSDDWLIVLKTSSGASGSYLVDARTKQPRQFKTLDTAIRTLQEIGFKVDYLGQ